MEEKIMLYNEFYGNTKGCANLSEDYPYFDFYKDMEKIYIGTTLSKMQFTSYLTLSIV